MTNENKDLKETEDKTSTQNGLTEENKELGSKVEENNLKKQANEADANVYKEELERLIKERDNYKQGMLNAKKENKELKTKTVEEDLTDLDSKIEKKLSQAQEKWLKDRIQDDVDNTIMSVAKSKEEQELIRYIYNNRIQISGTSRKAIEQDIKDAKLLANRNKVELVNEELKESLKTKKTIDMNAGVSGKKMIEGYDVSQFSDADISLMKRRGISLKEMAKKLKNK